ncbi:MAG: hypothetical protein ACOYZ7_02665 [Chloroflexota bacterium]
MQEKERLIDPLMTVLDVVYRFKDTVGVFDRYEAQAGECICCMSLFETLEGVAAKYGLDLPQLLSDLEAVAGSAGLRNRGQR